MSDAQHQDDDLVFLDISDQPVVSHAVPPFPTAVGGQAFAVPAGILAPLEVLADPAQDQRRRMAVQLLEVLGGRPGKAHMVRNASPSSFSISYRL